METARLIKALRKEKGLTQAQLSEKVGLDGQPGSQLISNIERGICHPPFNRVNLFAKILGVRPSTIFKAMYLDDSAALQNKYKEMI